MPTRDLPPPPEQDWLIEAFGDLVRARGHASVLRAPMVLATPAHFPDPWRADLPSVKAMLRRVLRYAGLNGPITLTSFREARRGQLDQRGELQATEHKGTAAWYAGHDGDALEFGVEAEGVKDPVSLAGTLCHEAAHAYRDLHGLMLGTGELEEKLTDLTTVYLGFGVLTVNASYMYRAGSTGDGSFASQWSFQSRGYLKPEAMSFLLAAWALLRGARPEEVRRHLEPNQAACFSLAWGVLERRPRIFYELGLPEEVARQRTVEARAAARRSSSSLKLAAAGLAVAVLAAGGALGWLGQPGAAAAVVVCGAALTVALRRRAGRLAATFVDEHDQRVTQALAGLPAAKPRGRQPPWVN